MIKLLVISYHYLPDNIIAARRSEAYAKHFHKFGIFPTVLTDLYEGTYNEKGNRTGYKNHSKTTQPVFENSGTKKVIRLPRIVNTLQKFQLLIQQVPLASSLFTFIMQLNGHFDMHLLAHYTTYKRFLLNHLKNNSYDAILAIDSPHYHIKLAFEINKKFEIPYICDFRDLYDNRILSENFNPTIRIKIIHYLKRVKLRHWLSNATYVTSVSKPWADFYGLLSGRPNEAIANGFETSKPTKFNSVVEKKFILAHTGRIYPNQNWEIFIQGVKKFILVHNPVDLKIVFVGIRKDAHYIIRQFEKNIPTEYMDLRPWVPYEEVLKIQNNSSVLVLSAWQDYKGVYSGKIFEYLGARKPILFAPGDHGDVIDQLLDKTKAGVSANTSDEVFSYLSKKYTEWIKKGVVLYEGIENEIIQYSRENQVRKMANLIMHSIKKIELE